MKVILAIHHSFELWNAPDWLGPRLQGEFSQHPFVELHGFYRFYDETPDSEVMVGLHLLNEQLQKAKKLRWIHATTAAVHQLMFPELIASDVRVTNSTSIHGPVVAEHAIALGVSL